MPQSIRYFLPLVLGIHMAFAQVEACYHGYCLPQRTLQGLRGPIGPQGPVTNVYASYIANIGGITEQQVVLFDTPVVSAGGISYSSASGLFTVPLTGSYLVTYSLQVQASAAPVNDNFSALINLCTIPNGASGITIIPATGMHQSITAAQVQPPSNCVFSVIGHCVVPLSSGDQLGLQYNASFNVSPVAIPGLPPSSISTSPFATITMELLG